MALDNWPITRERYRQVLATKRRHWVRIQELEALLNGTEAEEVYDNLRLRISELEERLDFLVTAIDNAKA